MANEALYWLVAVTAVGGVVELSLALVAVRNRETPGARAFAWLTFAAGGWSCLQVVYLVTASGAVARVAYQLTAPVSYQVAMLWFVFAVVYTGRREWLTPMRLVGLWTPLTVYLFVRWTAPVHGVFPAPVTVRTVSGITAPAVELTPSVLGATLVAYCYVLAGFVLLLAFTLRSRNVYRKQAAAIVVGGLFPAVGTVAYTAGTSVHPGVSLSPHLFAVHGVVTALALFRYNFLSVAPVATDLLAEELDEPVLVLDDDGVVLDHNPAATRLVADERLVDEAAGDALPQLSGPPEDGTQISVDAPGYDRDRSVFSLTVTAVEDQFDRSRGHLVLLRDVTDQKRRLEQLTAVQAATRRFISARTTAEVADIAVAFASDVHDQPYAALFRYVEGADALVASAVTDHLAAELGVEDSASLRVPRGSGPLWQTYTGGESVAFEGERDVVVGPYAFGSVSALFLPLGDHGVLVIGTDAASDYTAVDEQLGGILARTTETALTRVEHEGELRASRIAVERRNEQIEFFNGVLRHNIRNAMLVVDGHAGHLRSRVDGEADREKVDTIREWCRELTELTEKIRAINDTVTASESERLERVDLSAMLHERVVDLSDRYEGVAIDYDADGGLTVAANDLLSDVLSGVLSNAVEHNDAARPRVCVDAERADGWVRVTVADNGPGLSEDLKTRVFERELATGQTANGFGLYFVSVMMDLYNGNVRFDDNDPRGTVVVLELRPADDALAESPG
ncbi:histidine kinase N-terminal 7TM domain-containing protein [Halosimplex amylolyticum]|uniref:sensor histidine kinase n=1 Tax=Halosimplex amylolyticum TaxID=3396616 RepID=UPI003F549556